MTKLLSFILFLVISVSSVAQVKLVEKDTPAPYTGYLFTPEAEKDIRFKLVDLDYYKKLAEVNTERLKLSYDQQKLLEEQVVVWRDTSKDLSKQLAAKESRAFWEKLLYFGLGAAVTVGLAYSVNKVTK